MRYDYKEMVRLPVGPDEPESWFYPEFQTEVTVLAGLMVYINPQGVREVHYHTMVTNVIEHNPNLQAEHPVEIETTTNNLFINYTNSKETTVKLTIFRKFAIFIARDLVVSPAYVSG